MKKYAHVFYSGRVQGVGFRYTVLDIARQQKICGWVKNLDDGRVEVSAEAEEDLLKVFFEQVKHDFSQYIQDVDLEWLPANGEFRDFQIKF
ncbi:MAG: acylphosphatase [Candidatus Omnitrophica bacterium CG11_big_fil_rev_8_21_14_0_20_41_12]|nr:MAG: acylphosphatase [Candidatus Omnitrophica bacterium CG11_big_fil_rev_8_21_14_0_20_41_12]